MWNIHLCSDPVFRHRGGLLAAIFQFCPFILTLVVPAITMGLIAEDRRSGMLELMQSWPIGDFEFVCGKFIGAWLLTFFAWALSLVFPFSIAALGPLIGVRRRWLFRIGNSERGLLKSGTVGKLSHSQPNRGVYFRLCLMLRLLCHWSGRNGASVTIWSMGHALKFRTAILVDFCRRN